MSNESKRRLKELLNYLEESVDMQRQAESRLTSRIENYYEMGRR